MKITCEEYLKTLIQEQFPSIRAFSEHINMPYSTLTSILKNVGGASITNLRKITGALNIKLDDLATYEEKSSINQPRVERDIQKRLQSILDDMNSEAGLAFYNGNEEMDEETKELLKISLEASIRTAKKRAQDKFTPKKYKKSE